MLVSRLLEPVSAAWYRFPPARHTHSWRTSPAMSPSAMSEDEKCEGDEWPVPQFPINEAVAVQPSPLGSSGLFALRDFVKGDGACVVRARSCTRSASQLTREDAAQRCSRKRLFCRY